MGAVLDLDLWGHQLRVRVEIPDAAEALRVALSDHLRAEPAPLGFVVQRPTSRGDLHTLIDRSGLLLARSRSWQDVVAVLAEHLTSFAPPPTDTVRTTMRAVIRCSDTEKKAVLAGFPLLSLPTLVERQLERRGQRVVDRMAVDMTPEGEISLSHLPWPSLRANDPMGHCGVSASGALIKAILAPTDHEIAAKDHELIALIASTLRNLTVEAALDLAENFMGLVRTVPISDVKARRRALEF